MVGVLKNQLYFKTINAVLFRVLQRSYKALFSVIQSNYPIKTWYLNLKIFFNLSQIYVIIYKKRI